MKISKVVFFAASALSYAAAFAGTQDIKASNNQFSVEAISTNVNYTEYGDVSRGSAAGPLDSEKGSVPGFGLSLSLMKDWLLGNDYLQIQYSRANGHTNYTGSYQSGGGYGSLLSTSGATLSDFSIRAGKGFSPSSSVMLTPYGEYGYHQWNRAVNQGETYSNNYVGIGALVQYSPVNHLVLSTNALLAQTFGSHIDVSGSQAYSGALGNSSLYKIGLAADYAFTQKLHGNVGVDYTSFKYGESAIWKAGSKYYYEPSDTTKYTTVHIGIGYAF